MKPSDGSKGDRILIVQSADEVEAHIAAQREVHEAGEAAWCASGRYRCVSSTTFSAQPSSTEKAKSSSRARRGSAGALDSWSCLVLLLLCRCATPAAQASTRAA